MSSFSEKTISTNSIFEGKVISLQVDDVELPNGKMGQREIVKHPGAVAIIAFTAEGKLVLVRQFRKPLEKEIFEIPAGKLEKGEDPLQCAFRELEEETGYTSKQCELLVTFYTSPGFADELIYVYEAGELSLGEAHTDEDEFVEVVAVTLEEALEMVKKEQIHDAKTMYAIMHWQVKKLTKNE
jgi:ADP-ribose pyrophosphatase